MKRIASLLLITIIISNACRKVPTSADVENKVAALPTPKIEKIPAALQIGKIELSQNLLEKELQVYTITDTVSFDSSLTDLIYRKRIYLEAQNKGYGKSSNDAEEIATYQAILAKDYLIDSTLLNEMIVEAYEHLKEEINASHIFIAFSQDASHEDSLSIYNELMEIRNKAFQRNAFDSLAMIYSQDKRTAGKGGNLGWFSALQMFYPIEKAAYGLQVGQISSPIRSSAGYHLVKLNDRRPSQGSVTVRHILKAVPDWNNKEQAANQKLKIEDILSQLKNGEDFETLVANESDDQVYASRGGVLPSFSVGNRAEENFEKIAFGLKVNEFSEVIKTTVGYHILQVVDKKGLSSLGEMRTFIKNKVTTDSRGEYLEESMLKTAKEKINYKLDSVVLQMILSSVDANILQGNWKNANLELPDLTLIKTIDGDLKAGSFIEFMMDRQSYDQSPAAYNSKMAARRYFRIFEKNLIKDTAERMSATWNPELSQQIQQLKESLVTTDFLNDFIFEKAVADTVGQRRYYEENKNSYLRKARRYALLVKGNDKLFVENVKVEFEAEKPFRLKRGIYPFYFSKNYYFLSDEDKVRLNGLIALLDKNKDYSVEVGGHIDVAEEDYVSSTRIKTIVNYLVEMGLPITRIIEYDYLKTRPADRFDWSKNQRVSIQFFSNNELDLLPSIDPDKKHLLSVEKKWFDQSNENIWNIAIGESAIFEEKNGEFAYCKIIKEQESGYLSLREAKTQVIKDYQNQLEEKLKAELEKKYPINNDSAAIQFLKTKILSQN